VILAALAALIESLQFWGGVTALSAAGVWIVLEVLWEVFG
jgi:hypothetical protein